MTTTNEVDPLEHVRTLLNEIPKEERPRIAVNAGVSLSTLYNIKNGKRDVKYGNVMALLKVLKEAKAAAAAKPVSE